MSDRKPIRSEDFRGITIDHFRALMQQLAIGHQEGWMSSNGERLVSGERRQTAQELVGLDPTSPFYQKKHYKWVDVTPPTRGSWEVRLVGGEETEGYAGVEVYERPGRIHVDFLDGHRPHWLGVEYPPIGSAFEEFCEMIVKEVRSLMLAREAHRGGHPGLDHDELVYRLAKAEEAEEIRSENPDMTWKEIAKDIDWRYGIDERGLALLRVARLSRLPRLKKDDPHGLLQQVARWRKDEEETKAKKT